MRTIIQSDAPSVEAQSLTKIYGYGNTEVVAMRDVSFQVGRGEVVALVGPSGAGKSTLLTAIGLINPPTSGKITISGCPVMDGPRPLVDLRAFRRKHLGFVFQKANLIPVPERPGKRAGGAGDQRRPSPKGPEACLGAAGVPGRRGPHGTVCPPRSPAASSSAWPWPERWRTTPA